MKHHQKYFHKLVHAEESTRSHVEIEMGCTFRDASWNHLYGMARMKVGFPYEHRK